MPGKTVASLPKINGVTLTETYRMHAIKTKGGADVDASVCFSVRRPVGSTVLQNIGSMCVTPNHWANPVSSVAFIQDCYVPWVHSICLQLNPEQVATSASPAYAIFAKQVLTTLA